SPYRRHAKVFRGCGRGRGGEGGGEQFPRGQHLRCGGKPDGTRLPAESAEDHRSLQCALRQRSPGKGHQRSSHVAVSDRRLHRGRKNFYQHDAALSNGCALSCFGSGPDRSRGRESGPADCRRGSSRTFPAFGYGTGHRCWLTVERCSLRTAEKLGFRIRVSGFVSGYRFSDTARSKSNTPLGVCVRTRFRTVWWNQAQENSAPEGRPSLAQRFSAGKSGRNDSSPGGTTDVLTHTL